MMQAGVRLGQDTETTLPELPEQHRIREKEEELHGLESVHMAESETKCTAPGLNTLEPECVSVHSGVSDVHHSHTLLIKTEPDLGFTHSEYLIKTESLDSTELGYATHLHPDQIKTENDDGGYLQIKHVSAFQDIKNIDMKCDQIKHESSENLVSDLRNFMMTETDSHEDQSEPWQCSGEPNLNRKREENYDLLSQTPESHPHCYVTLKINNENNPTKIVCNGMNDCKTTGMEFERTNVRIASKTLESSLNPGQLDIVQIRTMPSNECGSQMREKRHQCMQCGKYFSQMSHLNRHQRVHTGEKPYKCTECGKCFSQSSVLNYHSAVHTGKKLFKCAVCEKFLSTSTALNIHLRIHTGEKPYKCTDCEKCFRTKSVLNIHKRIHTGEKPYICTLCCRCFTTKAHLISHQRMHSGEKPHKCDICGKFYSTNSALNAHMRIHTGEKPYSCPECGECFSRTKSLNCHRMIHTGEKPSSTLGV